METVGRHILVNPALKGIWEHIRDLGLGALAHAHRHAAYAAMENPRWPELSVLQAAHAAELLIKARIAQEHPLLIFEQLPRFTQASGLASTCKIYSSRVELFSGRISPIACGPRPAYPFRTRPLLTASGSSVTVSNTSVLFRDTMPEKRHCDLFSA